MLRKLLRPTTRNTTLNRIISATRLKSSVASLKLPQPMKDYAERMNHICQPDDVVLCDGSEGQKKLLYSHLERQGVIKRLTKLDNCWLARTDPADVARVENRTFISTASMRDTVPLANTGSLGNWISPQDMDAAFRERFPGCMKGRTMYVIPFSMGPLGNPMSKFGLQVTDSAYVAASMAVMTRVGDDVIQSYEKHRGFTKCLHSVGSPLPEQRPTVNNWPCNPPQTIISHLPDKNEVVSFGSGYGGNSLLGKKCFALRLGSIQARREGWMAEHMLIMAVTNPRGKKRYIAAAFPSACGKTNMAMMRPTLKGYKVECVGDDIAWMHFGKDGRLYAINPEAGFFGVAPGTSLETNPVAMETIRRNTLFTNVAETGEGGFFWEGLEKETNEDLAITSWTGEPWKRGDMHKAAHPNSRFCVSAKECPILDENWERAVPIDAFLFGGRRPKGVPLVYEAFNWKHGVLIGASMRSEATAAAEHKNVLMNDPFAMRPFFGYNFGKYLNYWLSLEFRQGVQLPRIFHVNWFLKNHNNEFEWPGFGENSRVLDWICRRLDNEPNISTTTPIGHVPLPLHFNFRGIEAKVDPGKLFNVDRNFWLLEASELRSYFDKHLGEDLPQEITNQLNQLEQRLKGLA